jgi:hypothetical protein
MILVVEDDRSILTGLRISWRKGTHVATAEMEKRRSGVRGEAVAHPSRHLIPEKAAMTSAEKSEKDEVTHPDVDGQRAGSGEGRGAGDGGGRLSSSRSVSLSSWPGSAPASDAPTEAGRLGHPSHRF